MIPDPACATIDTAEAGVRVRSESDGRVEHGNGLFDGDTMRRCLPNTRRACFKEERKMSPQEGSQDHNTAADHRKIGFGDGEGGRDGGGACKV